MGISPEIGPSHQCGAEWQEVPLAWYPYRYCVFRRTRWPVVIRTGSKPSALTSTSLPAKARLLVLITLRKRPLWVSTLSPRRIFAIGIGPRVGVIKVSGGGH